MTEPVDTHDHRCRRCPMLGHEVSFAYCRQGGSGQPCRRVFDCWWETFDVEAFMRAQFGEETLQRMRAPRQDKMVSLVELIQRAQQRSQAGESSGRAED